jgi:CheY-like chemotaxis protein
MSKILIVEDYDSLQKIYQMGLTLAGYEVEVAQDGAQALEMAGKQHYDLILLDILLPKKSGIKFLHEFQPKRRTPPVKVIAISNAPTQDIMEEAYKHGVDRFLTKLNVVPMEIADVIREVLAEKPAARA